MSVPTLLTAKYPGTCVECHRRFKPGTRIIWSQVDKTTRHVPEQCHTYYKDLKKKNEQEDEEEFVPRSQRLGLQDWREERDNPTWLVSK